MKTLLCCVLSAFLAFVSSASAQTSPGTAFFLEIEAIQGEAKAPGFEKQIELVTLNTAVRQRGLNLPGITSPSGRPAFQPVKVIKFVDAASPGLFVGCATGRIYPQAIIRGVRLSDDPSQPGAEFFTITLRNVSIACVNTEGAEQDGGTQLLETVTLSYEQILWSYRPVLPDGQLGTPTTGGYNLKARAKL